jgi:hypothetical protein
MFHISLEKFLASKPDLSWNCTIHSKNFWNVDSMNFKFCYQSYLLDTCLGWPWAVWLGHLVDVGEGTFHSRWWWAQAGALGRDEGEAWSARSCWHARGSATCRSTIGVGSWSHFLEQV